VELRLVAAYAQFTTEPAPVSAGEKYQSCPPAVPRTIEAMELTLRDPIEAQKARLRAQPSRDWQQLAEAHAIAVREEERAYAALLSADPSRADRSSGGGHVDPTLLASWAHAAEAVTIAWERLHRHAIGVESMY